MPFTRNLYELDEVISSLETCLRNRWPGLFWLCELVLSEEQETALDILKTGWLLHAGGIYPSIMETPKPTTAREGIILYLQIESAISQSRGVTAARLLTVEPSARPSVTLPPHTPEERSRRMTLATVFSNHVKSVNEPMTAQDAQNWIISLEQAYSISSPANAVWLLQSVQMILSPDTIWTALQICKGNKSIEILRRAATTEPDSQLLNQTAAILHLCNTDSAIDPPTPKTALYERDWCKWTENQGRRKARIKSPPDDALHADTTRGSMSSKYSNIFDLREPIGSLAESAQFWQIALNKYGISVTEGEISFPNDETYESFYATYFPDDIPDEWSKADQERSHGRGYAEKALPAPTKPQPWPEPLPETVWKEGIKAPWHIDPLGAKKLTHAKAVNNLKQDNESNDD